MSGGALTDYRHNLYQLEEWACRVRSENPLLAEMMNDLYDLLDEYDMYLSGDSDKDSVGKAWDVIRTTKRASISNLQRKLGIGYNRAAKIIDILEEQGRIGPDLGPNKQREIYE